MQTSRPCVRFGLLAMCLVATCGPATAAPSAQEQALMKRVAVLWNHGRRAIQTVQCDYYDDLNGGNRHVRYARDGDMYYHGSRVINPKGGFGIVSEVAWDGQRAAHRHSYRMMNYGSTPDRASTACPTPDRIVSYSAERALGLVDDPERGFEFLGAQETEHQGHPSIELRFRMISDQSTYVFRHGQDVGYWPVYEHRVDGGGGAYFEMTDVKYARFESDGNALFYPVRAYREAWGGTRYPHITRKNGGNHMTLVVDEGTLKINQPVPLSRFQIVPWPNEQVYEEDTERYIEPANPNWSAVGNVDFPWDKVVAGFEKVVAETTERNDSLLAAVGSAAGSRTVGAAAASPASGAREYLNAPLVCGMLLVAGSIYWMYRRRRAA